MKIALHIGAHKTGTTTIQRTLYLNSAALLKHGFYYHSSDPEHFNHHVIAAGLKRGTKNETREWAVAALLAHIDQAAAADCHTCILSSEMFVEGADTVLIREILTGHTLQIIAYLRRPDELIASAHNQVVREPNRRWPRAIDERPYPYDPSYWDVLSNWLATFGPAEMTLAPFDEKQWANENLVEDFLQMVGLTENVILESDMTSPEMNFSLPTSLIEIIRLANALVPMSFDVHRAFVHSLYELRKQHPHLYPSDVSLMDDGQRRDCFRSLARKLPRYRPYFRPGFDEDFLHWRRASLREWIVKTILRVSPDLMLRGRNLR